MSFRVCGLIIITLALLLAPAAVSAQDIPTPSAPDGTAVPGGAHFPTATPPAAAGPSASETPAPAAPSGPAPAARLLQPNLDAFPRIEAYLDVRDADGKFISGLQTASLSLLEDNNPLPIAEMSELRPGAQIVVAINPGPTMGIRNSQGLSRFDFIFQALSNWAKSRQGSNVDDWSLVTTGDLRLDHTANPNDWVQAIKNAPPDVRTAVPSLDTLFRAVTLAADPPPRLGMGRAVLFITPPVEGNVSLSLENLIAQARQEGVHINIWMVASAGSYSAQVVKGLNDIAVQTGGTFFAYTGEEPLPDPENYLTSLRSIYRIAYDSKVKTGGAHQVVVEAQLGSGKVSSPPQTFDMEIQPPDPAFISPVLQIERRPLPAAKSKPNASSDPADYVPSQQQIKILVSFPDGHTRPLVRTTLFVDGNKVAENRRAPFDQFNWSLAEYTTSGTHSLKVEAEDVLGNVGASMDTLVMVSVATAASNPLQSIYQRIPVVAGLAVLLAGAVLLLVLVVGGRIRPNTQRWAAQRTRRKTDPVTQPVPMKNEPAASRRPGWVNRLQWPQRHAAPKAYAFLSRISDTDQMPTSTPIAITAEEITLGNDHTQATLLVEDPSVEALHARLRRLDDGSFRLADEGSVAGTWINYTPVSREGATLEHGDLVHIGRVGFRFTLRQPRQVAKPVIIPQETDEDLEP